MVFGGIIAGFGSSLDDGGELEGWRNLDERDVEDLCG